MTVVTRRIPSQITSEQDHKSFSDFSFRLDVYTKSGSDAITGLTKTIYDGTEMLAGMGSSTTTANLGDHVELKLVNTGSNVALDNFA